jgi:hypothetical protein
MLAGEIARYERPEDIEGRLKEQLTYILEQNLPLRNIMEGFTDWLAWYRILLIERCVAGDYPPAYLKGLKDAFEHIQNQVAEMTAAPEEK